MLKYGLDLINIIVYVVGILLLAKYGKRRRDLILLISVLILSSGLKTTLTPIYELTPYYGKNNQYYTQMDIKQNGYFMLALGIIFLVSTLLYSIMEKVIVFIVTKANKPNTENKANKSSKEINYVKMIDEMTKYTKDTEEISRKIGLNKYFIDDINKLRNKFNDEYINSLIKTVKYRVDNNIVIPKKKIKEISEKEKDRIIEGEKNKINNIFLAAELFRDGHAYIDVINKTELLPIYVDVISKNYNELLSLNIDKNNKALLEFFYSRSKEYREYIKELDLYYDFLEKYLPESYPEFVREVQALNKKSLEMLEIKL